MTDRNQAMQGTDWPEPETTGRRDGLLWLMAPPLLLTAIVFWPITRNYFFGDDLLAVYETIHKPLLNFLFEPYGGHVMATRNVIYLILYELFGPNPSANFFIVLLTHLLNVALLFLVIRELTGARLACFGATLWGAAAINGATLGWYQAYGVVLAVAAQLWILYRLVRIRRTGRVSRLEVSSWGLLLFGASTCFGTGIAITLAMPAVAWLLLPATPARRRATVGLTIAAACVVAGYLTIQQLGPYLFPNVRHMSMLRAALARWQTVPWLAWLMMMHGLSVLFLGPLAHHASAGGLLEWALSAAVLIATGAIFVAARTDTRRLILACLLSFGIGYSMIAAGRAPLWTTGMKLVAQGHYHYTAPVALAILSTLLLAELARRWRPSAAVANTMLGLWFLTFAAVHFVAAPPIDNHDVPRKLAEQTLAQIETLVLSQPPGADVYIKNQPFFGVGPFVIKNPQTFPGIAGLFAVYYPDQLLQGRRVYFVESELRVLFKLAARPYQAMLISSDLVPADRILELPKTK